MNDLIDRDEAINEIHKLIEQSTCRATDQIDHMTMRIWNKAILNAEVVIRGQPKADTQQHAHWIIKYDMGEPVGAICSNCESEIGYDRNGCFSEMNELYCHNCGCKMDEKTE